jgi:hypothetical protein
MTLYAVILSNAKDLLAGYALSTLSLVGFEEILHYVQNDIHNIRDRRDPRDEQTSRRTDEQTNRQLD